MENLAHQQVQTSLFDHSVYKKDAESRYQVVFIEGDGRPWDAAGALPSQDPTPRDALAFDLMSLTPAESYFVTRPCYFETWNEQCTSETWTSGRFSDAVVASLAEAIRMTADPERPLILVGYSGGGALAVLIAIELGGVDGVVTVAGLLDTDAWTAHHGYEPLSGSRNPSALAPTTRQIFLHGAGDAVVPLEQTRRVAEGWSDSELRVFENFDHVCCWRRDWPQIWRQIEADLGLAHSGQR